MFTACISLSLPIPSLSRTHYYVHTQLHTTDPNFNHADSQQKEYIAWQSRFIYLINNTKLTAFFISAWDLLRVDVYGFKQFCEYFFKAHPYNFVSPLRVSGSAVEMLFSQYKYAVGGKLDSSNYATARAACLVKSAVAQSHHSGKGYRDATLHT